MLNTRDTQFHSRIHGIVYRTLPEPVTKKTVDHLLNNTDIDLIVVQRFTSRMNPYVVIAVDATEVERVRRILGAVE